MKKEGSSGRTFLDDSFILISAKEGEHSVSSRHGGTEEVEVYKIATMRAGLSSVGTERQPFCGKLGAQNGTNREIE